MRRQFAHCTKCSLVYINLRQENEVMFSSDCASVCTLAANHALNQTVEVLNASSCKNG